MTTCSQRACALLTITSGVLAFAAHVRAQEPTADAALDIPAPAELSTAEPPAEEAPRASEASAEPEPREDDPPLSPGEEKKAKKPKPTMVEKRAIATTPVGVFGLKGRVFAYGELIHRSDLLIVDSDGVARRKDLDTFDISLDSARFSILYQIPDKWLMTEIEVEVSDPDQVELRDAYLLATAEGFSMKVGNFKLPTSAIELESAWTLPSSRRGFVNELLLDYLDVADRRPGVQVAYRHRGGIDPTLTLGTYQGSVLIEHIGDDRDTELLEEASLDAQSWAARAQIDLGKFEIGAFFEHRVGSPAPLQTQHYPVVGGDVVFADEFGNYGLRGWVDFHYGESWYVHPEKPAADGAPWFLAARAILAFRYGGTADGELYVEPFASFGMLDPDLDVRSDWAREFTLGVNVGLWDRGRVTLEAYLDETSRNFPTSYFGGAFTDTMALALHLEAAF